MILPQNMTPLPVGPPNEDLAISEFGDGDDFVLRNDVYRVLLGASGGLPVEGLPAGDQESFAGRGDVKITRTSPFIGIVEDRPAAVAPAALTAIHPVFATLTAARRAAPPRIVMDIERDFGTTQRGADRWWMLGVALAVAAITLSGTFVDFTSREAVRRAGLEHRPVTTALPAIETIQTPALTERPAPLASAQGPAAVR